MGEDENLTRLTQQSQREKTQLLKKLKKVMKGTFDLTKTVKNCNTFYIIIK